MAVSDWSEDADLNVSIDGINIAEGCPPSNVNNALRAIMANVKAFKTVVDADVETAVAGAIATAGSSATAYFDRFFPQGCRMLFQQTAAPSGWTKVTTYSNAALRLVSGSVSAYTAGKAFSSCFAAGRATTSKAAGGTVQAHKLTVAEMPAHKHDLLDGKNNSGPDAHDHSLGWQYGYWGIWRTSRIGSTGGNQPHSHGFTGASHNHTLDLNVNYVDVILAQRGA